MTKFLATRDSGRPWTRARRFLITGLLLLAAALVLAAPASMQAIGLCAAMPNLGRLGADLLAMGAAYCILALSTAAPDRDPHPRRRLFRHGAVFVIGAVVMAVLLDAANTAQTSSFVSTYGHDPLITLYLAIYAGYLIWSMVTFHLLGHRYFHAPSTTIVARTGFRMVQGGLCCGYLWLLTQLADVLARHTSWPIATPAACHTVLPGLCAILVAAGVSFPEWMPPLLRTRTGRVLLRPVAHVRVMLALAMVSLLWRPLVRAFPEVVVDVAYCGRTTMLYRRVIEIRDIQLLLAPYVHPDAQFMAAARIRREPTHEHSLALIEAATLATGLDAFGVRRRYPTAESPTVDYVDHDRIVATPFDEARHLAAVAVAFRFSRTVRFVRRSLRPIAAHAAAAVASCRS
ncbi:MAB_1171c family putative transporter [Amycolatopsis sp. TNS106]|uniref:MAB_1171c family putative transporter n=1 Tax=Amycolatopsis sp. TNS106 TaxID=2861750 RepID=UPI001C583162|nr:MAB_1171c family putative transporter [Amycolatopsis sp. TNS106]